jgi:hypothetical protein
MKNTKKKKQVKPLELEHIDISKEGNVYVVTSSICPNIKCIGNDKEDLISKLLELYQNLS